MPRLSSGEVIVLDGTLVFVEDVQPTFAAVVALPEQSANAGGVVYQVFTPGRVGAKKVSPFCTPEAVISPDALSATNREFIDNYRDLRKQHGAGHVVPGAHAPREAALTVRKAGPRQRSASPEDRDARRAARRAGKKKCAVCGLPAKDHPDTSHEFTARTRRAAPASGLNQVDGAHPASRRVTKSEKFRVVSNDLSKAQAHSDKFKKGNRFYRVFAALQALPDSTGTFEEVCAAVERDGAREMTNVVKVVKRALKQLASDACGKVVARA